MKKRIFSFFLAFTILLSIIVPISVSADYIQFEDVYVPEGYSYYGAWRWSINDKFYIGYFTSSPYVDGTEMMYSYSDGGNPENVRTALNYKLYGGKCLYYKFDSYEDMVIALSSAEACQRLCSSSNSSTGYMRLTAFPDVYFSNFSIDSGDCVFNENLYSSKLIDTYLGRDSNNSSYWVGAIVGSHNVSGFTEWFLLENKINDLVNIGFSTTTDKVEDVIGWWDKYGATPYSISIGLPSLISITALNNLSISLVERVVYTLDSLYLQYKNYCNTQDIVLIDPSDNSMMPHHRLPVSDDSDYTLTTDFEDDDIIISLLREILRTLIYLPSDIYNYLGYLETYLDAILIDFNRLIVYIDSLPDHISSSIYNFFVTPITDIITAINNIDGGSDVIVDITDNSKDEVNLFFDDWATKFDTTLSNKFPILSQLQELFTDFFVKCGIDTSAETQNKHYFEPDVAQASYLDIGSVSSAGTAQLLSNTDPLTAIGEVFPESNISYLNFDSEDIPKITINVAGEKKTIVDFKLYARYRKLIFSIISFILWVGFLLGLYKSAPSIIGRVSDIRDVVVNKKGDD